MNRSEEDYIKTIYELIDNSNSDIIKSIDIAESMNFTDQSVNEMVKKLSKKGYLEFIPYKGIKITTKGTNEAIRLIRAHRVWEVFLMDHLNYSWHEVHEQAEFLEHSGNDELVNRLYKYIGKPKYCVHGNPIPSTNGHVNNIYKKSLYNYQVNDTFTLSRVLDNKELLTFLDINNISINDTFTIIEKDDFSGLIKLKKDNNIYIISNKIAKMIFN